MFLFVTKRNENNRKEQVQQNVFIISMFFEQHNVPKIMYCIVIYVSDTNEQIIIVFL